MITKKLGFVVGAAVVGFIFGIAFYAGSAWVPRWFEKEPVELVGEGDIVRPLQSENTDGGDTGVVSTKMANVVTETPKPVTVETEQVPVVEETISPNQPVEETTTTNLADTTAENTVPREPSGQELAYEGQDQDPEPIQEVVSEEDANIRQTQLIVQQQLTDTGVTNPGNGGGNNNGGGNTDPVDPTDPPVVTPDPVRNTIARADLNLVTNPATLNTGTAVETEEGSNGLIVTTNTGAEANTQPIVEIVQPTTQPQQQPQTWYSNALAGSVSGLIGGMSNTSTPVGYENPAPSGRVLIRQNSVVTVNPSVTSEQNGSVSISSNSGNITPTTGNPAIIQSNTPGIISGSGPSTTIPVNNGTTTGGAGSTTVIPGNFPGIDLGITPNIGIRVP